MNLLIFFQKHGFSFALKFHFPKLLLLFSNYSCLATHFWRIPDADWRSESSDTQFFLSWISQLVIHKLACLLGCVVCSSPSVQPNLITSHHISASRRTERSRLCLLKILHHIWHVPLTLKIPWPFSTQNSLVSHFFTQASCYKVKIGHGGCPIQWFGQRDFQSQNLKLHSHDLGKDESFLTLKFKEIPWKIVRTVKTQ